MKNHDFLVLYRRIFCTCLFFLTTLPAAAQELELTGIGAYNEFNNISLLIQLESINPANDTSELNPSAITNRFSFHIVEPKTPRRWNQFWSQNLSLNNSVASVTENFDNLIAITDAIKDTLETGDLLTFGLQRDDTLVLKLNDVELKRLSNSGFYDFLLTALTGSIPPSSILKSQLLGEDTSEFDTNLSLFDGLSYNDSRVASITAWITPIEESEPEISAEEEASELAEIEAAEDAAQKEEEERLAAEAAKREAEALAAAEAAAEEARQAALDLIVANQQHIQSVLRKIYANIEYPRSAIRQEREGVVRIALTLNRDGSLAKAELVEETRYKDLNNAALESVDAATPFDPMPEANEDDQTVIQFPIRFQLAG